MILVGGSNVYPAEVEAALDEHPRALSGAVIGLPDDDLGSRPHAIVQTDDGTPIDEAELRAFLPSASCATRSRAPSSSSANRSATTPASSAAARSAPSACSAPARDGIRAVVRPTEHPEREEGDETRGVLALMPGDSFAVGTRNTFPKLLHVVREASAQNLR